ncbi:MAG: MarR family transcriptional regulator [Pararhodobacter sp.]|nr:MarR family transcriptional regulator [Pararhodobacter sp.]
MSSPDRQALEARLAHAIMQWQDATQRFDEAAGRRLDLNPAERRCLAMLVQGSQQPSVLAAGVGLTRSAMTALVDRLRGRGLVERRRSEQDRRQILIEVTELARSEVMALYRPLAEGSAALLAKRNPSELETILGFVEEVLALQAQATDALEARQQTAHETD